MPEAMARWIIRISLCLILYSGGGVVTTVGVAWGLAAAVDPYDRASIATEEWTQHTRADARRQMEEAFPGQRFGRAAGGVVQRVGFRYNRVASVDAYGITSRSSVQAGLPLRALTGEYRSVYGEVTPRNAVVGSNVPFPETLLPLRPIFPGFIINTLFYAAIWFGIFFGVAALRRAIRRGRGRCVKCSYDLRGQFDKGCPECGWNRSEPRP